MTYIRQIVGHHGDDPLDETRHFTICPNCGQPIDCRDLEVMLHHEEPGHAALPAEKVFRKLQVSEQLRRTCMH